MIPTYDTKVSFEASTRAQSKSEVATAYVRMCLYVRYNREASTGCQEGCQKDRGCMMGKRREKDGLMRG